MGKQQQNQITPRRSVFNDLGLEANGITYDQFSKKFDENEEFRKSVYNDLGFEGQGIDYDKFYTTMGKPTEVSVQGSTPTSPILPEPTQSTNVPQPQQTGIDVSQTPPLGDASHQSLVVDGAQVPLGWRTQKVGDTTVMFDPMDPDNTVTNVLPEINVTRQATDKGFWSDLYNSLATGSSTLGSGIAGIPELVYNIAAVPQNLLADLTGDDSLRANYQTIAEGKYNPLGALVKADKYYQDLSEEHRNEVTKFNDDIIGSIQKGNLGSAGRQIANAFTESIPAMIGIAATSGAGSAAGLGAVGRNVVSSLPFASSKFQEIQDNQDIPSSLKPVVALASGLSEVVFEEGFGTQNLIKSIIDKSVGKESVKQFVTGYMDKLLSNKGIAASAFKGSIDEMSTQLAQNIIDKYSGVDPNKDLWEGVADAGIVGFASDGVISGLGKAADVKRISDLQRQNNALQNDLDNASPESQAGIQETIDKNMQSIDDIVNETTKVYNSLPEETKSQLAGLSKRRNDLEQSLNDPNISDDSKEAIQSQIDAIAKERDVIWDEGMKKVDEKPISPPEITPELVEKISETPIAKTNDTKNETRVPSEERVGEEPIQTEPQQGSGEEAAAPSGNVQAPQTQEINENIEVPSETPVENVEVAPVGEAVQQPEEVVGETTPIEEVSATTRQIPVQEEIVAPTQANQPVSDKVNPRLKEVIKSVPNQDLNTLMGPANVEARRDVIETVTGKRPSKNDAGINKVKQVVADYLGVTGNDSAKVQAIKDWANFERTEFSSPEEATRYVAENTTDPQEILRMYDEQPQLDQSDKGIAIAEWLGDTGKINLSDFTRWGDRNNLTRDISSRRIATGDNLKGLDAMLQDDGLTDQGITPEDVVDFITNYRDEADYRQVNRSETEKLLEDRYKDLTGRNITPKVLDKFRQKSSVERAENIAQEEASKALAEAGITQEELAAQQQMEAEQGREPRQESAGKTPKSLLKGISDRLSETGISKTIKTQNSEQITQLGFDGPNVNGFVDAEGNIVINSDTAGIDTPIHEFGHIWERTMETTNPELHARGMELIQGEDGKVYVDYVRQTQPGLQGDAIYKEALAQVIGDNGARLIETQKRSVIKDWLKAAWDFIASLRGLSGMTPNEIANLTLREYAEGAAVDLLQGKPINKTQAGNMVMETQATNEKEMTPAEKFNADFIRRRQQAQSIYFSGEINDLLSDADFRDYVEFTKNAIDMGQIPGKAEHDTLAVQLGITNIGQVDLAYKLATLRVKEATGIQTGQVSRDAAETANFESMSDTELREAGRQLVEQGIIDPVSMVNGIISKPRPISAQEVAALQYYQSNLNNEYATVSDLIDSRDQSAIDAYSFQGETGFKGLSIKADALRQASYDLDLAIIASGKEQSAAFRLRSVLSDKDFNIVSFLADMKSRGYITREQEAKFKAMANELADIKAKLKKSDERSEARKTKISEGNMAEVAKRNPNRRRNNRREVVEAFSDVLDGLNPDDFGLTGMDFQKGLVQFSMQPNTVLGQAVSDAIGRMNQSVKDGTMNVAEAIESAVSEIDAAVGKDNWDSIKFRSTIMNRMTNKNQVVKAAKPYVNSNGVLIVPGAYLTDLVRQGYETIDAMVAQTNTELGGAYSEYDIRNAISGYGRQAAPKLNEIERKKNVARTIARLLSELEDLNTKGERAKTEKVKHEIDNRVRALKDEIKQREYDLEMTPEERAQLAEQRYSDARRKYLENYIVQLQDRINAGDFAPQKHVNKYEDSPEVTALKAEAEKVKNEFKKAKYEHELKTMPVEQKAAKLVYEFVFNSTRALSAGSDLSAIGVQGAIFTFARPKEAAKLLWSSRKETFSPEQYEAYFANMQTDPYFEMARKAGLNLQLPGFYQSVQEEQFKGDVGTIIENYAFKPLARAISKVVGSTREKADRVVERISPLSAADRNYAVILSSIRLDLFKEFMGNQMTKVGLNAEIDADKVKQLAETVNTITMAATVPFTKGNKAANNITSALFFSLRKMIATWKILGMWAPMSYNALRGDATTKAFNRQLLRDTYGGIIFNGMGKMFALGAIPFIAGAAFGIGGDDDNPEEDSAIKAGARYMYNPNFFNAKHSDFMKLRLGDTRISLFQGIDGNVILATRLASGEYMTSSSNAVKELNGAAGNKTRRELGIDYMANKLAPTAAMIWRYTGSERERNEIGERFTQSIFPMWMSSAYEQYEATDSPYEAISLGGLGIIGLSYNNYGGAEFATKKGTNNSEARKIFKDSGLSAFNPTSGTRSYFDGEKVQKATDPFLGGKGFFSKEYLPAYEEFMNEAVLSNKDKLSVNVDWSVKEGLVNNLKKEAYKYAEIKTTGVAMGANFKNFSVDGEEYTLLPSQYKLKAKYIKLLMEDNVTPQYLAELTKEIREGDPKMTLKRAQMLALISAYNEANSEAKFNLMDDMTAGKIKLIKKTDVTKDMIKEDEESEE